MSPANQWGWNEIFANKTNYLLEMLLWQNSYSKKNRSRHAAMKPKPFVPDFMKPPAKPSAMNDGLELKETWEIDLILKQPRG